MNPREVILAPIISEKSHRELADGKYYFKVAPRATKTEISGAVTSIFKVNVTSVNIINIRSKRKAMGRFVGKTASWKKAIVTLEKGQKIPGIFEGM